jgi:uncharacterized membrane protein YedE/YeeE
MALRKRTKVIIGISAGVVVVAAAAVIAGPVIYANTVNGQAAAAPSLSAPGPAIAARTPGTGCTRSCRGMM